MGYNVLIADDFDVNRKLIEAFLKNRIDGINFFEAEDGVQALNIISETDIDLIILDLVMPEKGGFAVLEELSAHTAYKEIPVIVNSSLEDMDSVRKALEQGAVDYFTKPLGQDEINITMPLKVRNALKYYEQKKFRNRLNRQMEEELAFAGRFQASLMEETKNLPSACMHGKYVPCNKVGGDFYDCAQYEDAFWFIIADASGHGVVAAMVSSMVKTIFTHFVQHVSRPDEMLEYMNKSFCGIFGKDNDIFCSAFIGCIKGSSLYFSNAGHYYPFLYNDREGTLQILDQNGLLLGLVKNTEYKSREISIEPGDAVITYTDGLCDIGSKGSILNCDDIHRRALDYIDILRNDPVKFIDAFVESFRDKTAENNRDDATVMVIVKK